MPPTRYATNLSLNIFNGRVTEPEKFRVKNKK